MRTVFGHQLSNSAANVVYQVLFHACFATVNPIILPASAQTNNTRSNLVYGCSVWAVLLRVLRAAAAAPPACKHIMRTLLRTIHAYRF